MSEKDAESWLGSKEIRRFLESLDDLKNQEPLAMRNLADKQEKLEELLVEKGINGIIKRLFFYEKVRRELVDASDRVEFIKKIIKAHGIISRSICDNNPLHMESTAMLLHLLIEKVERNKRFFDDIPHSSSHMVLDTSRDLHQMLKNFAI